MEDCAVNKVSVLCQGRYVTQHVSVQMTHTRVVLSVLLVSTRLLVWIESEIENNTLPEMMYVIGGGVKFE